MVHALGFKQDYNFAILIILGFLTIKNFFQDVTKRNQINLTITELNDVTEEPLNQEMGTVDELFAIASNLNPLRSDEMSLNLSFMALWGLPNLLEFCS